LDSLRHFLKRLSFVRLSTGTKMLIILSTALLPIGLIALFASLDSAQDNRLQQESEARALAISSAREIDAVIIRVADALRDVASGPFEPICQARLERMKRAIGQDVRLAIFTREDSRLCATRDFSALAGASPRGRVGTEVRLAQEPEMLKLSVEGIAGRFAMAEIPARSLGTLVNPAKHHDSYRLTLRQGTAQLPLVSRGKDRPLDQRITVTAPVAKGQVALDLTVSASPISAVEVLLVLLPVLMWVAAAVIGWVVVDRLLLQPLAQIERAINRYGSGNGPLVLPRLATPAQEIRELGEAFRRAADAIAGHERDLEEGLARQRRLTREVHHRVKNNLQVVSSLINLHARNAPEQAAAAYASIQRRVDALAVVHRNHFAELEENQGLSLRALVGELASNLRATAPPEAGRIAITLDMMPAHTTQDVAVPVSFLITEVVELMFDCEPGGTVAIILEPGATESTALLTIESPALTEDALLACPTSDRFRRIVAGLSRQLRSPLFHEDGSGRYQVEIPIAAQKHDSDAD
jgi:two-component sensor histidine kinase